MDSKQLFLETKPVKLFFTAAIPGALSMLAMSLFGVFDGIFVGRLLGETSFAAVNLAFPFVIINFSLSDLIGVGSSVPISIYLGEKQGDKANNVFSMACVMNIVTGTFVGAIMYAFAPSMLKAMGATGELAALAVSYVRVYAMTSPCTTIVYALDNYLKISGKIKMSMWINIGMSLFGLGLEYVFLGVLKLPVFAAGLANCISMMLAALIAVYPFFRRRLTLKFVKPVFSVYETFRIIKCGTPVFLGNISGRITGIALNVMLLKFGGEEGVAVYGILMYVGEMIQPVVYGMCDSLAPAIGYNWGAKCYARVSAIAKICYIAAAVVSALSALLMCVFPAELASLYSKNTSPEFINTVVYALRLHGISRLVQWVCFTTQAYMSAVEKPLFSGIITVFSTFVFPMALLYLLSPFGLNGIWFNALFTMILSAVLSVGLLAAFKKEMKTKRLQEMSDNSAAV